MRDLVGEIRRLREGPGMQERPRGIGIVRFVAQCPGTAKEVLRRCREVLEVVLRASASDWPSDEAWEKLLPAWFVARSGEKLSQADADEWLRRWQSLSPDDKLRLEENQDWAVADWVNWLQPDQREWFWWDAVVDDPNTLRVAVEVEAWPFPWGALRWLLRACGATEVRAEEPTETQRVGPENMA